MKKNDSVKSTTYECILIIFIIFLTFGCASLVSFSHIVVKVQEQAEYGEWYVVDSIRHGDYLEVNASFIWSTPGSAGVHSLKWNIYQDNQLIRSGKEFKYKFTSSPFMAILKFNTSSAKKGDITFECFLDGKKVGEYTIQIL